MEQPKLLFEGKYEILAKIREGGMGTIYRVRHRLLDEIRVVKVMRPHVVADEDLKRRFLEEAKTAIRLKHPNLCAIHDFAADEGGTAYLVMEYIDGANLADLLKARGPFGPKLIVEIGHQSLLALGYLHRKGVIHRDVAPDNLMLTHDEDGRAVVKLIDLGIAKAVNRAMDMTGTGIFLGKLKYASPEQFGSLPAGEKLDGRSDLYGMGVVLYELMTGIRPHRGVSPAELLRAHLVEPPIPFSESDPHGRVPPELRALILRALEKKRDQRFASAEDFDQELMRLRGRFETPADIETTASILSTVRSTKPSASDGVTPSAQDRLDLHFGVQSTPSPSAPLQIVPPASSPGAPTVAVSPEDIETVSAMPLPAPGAPDEKVRILRPETAREPGPRKPPTATPTTGAPAPPAGPKKPPPASTPAKAEKSPAAQIPAPAPASTPSLSAPAGRRPRLALVAAAAIALAALLFWRPWAARHPSEEIAAAPSPVAETAAEPTAPPAPSPAPTAAPTHVPTAIPTSVPTAATTPRPVPTAAPRAPALAEAARVAAVAARRDADLARASERAPAAYQRALDRYSAALGQTAKGRDELAKKSFDTASTLFAQAAMAARAQALIPPTAIPTLRIAEAPTAPPRPTAAPLPPTAAPVEAVVPAPAEHRAPAPPAPAQSAATAEAREQITKVVGDYAWAQTTQDERLFSQVFPGGIDNFKLTFKNLKTQNVRLDIRSIDLTGTHATVAAHEVVVAKPRAGDEVRNEANVTLQLEKQGDRWVIVSRR